jgi:hypothetical protein
LWKHCNMHRSFTNINKINNALRTMFMMLLQSHQYFERLNLNLWKIIAVLCEILDRNWLLVTPCDYIYSDAVKQKTDQSSFINTVRTRQQLSAIRCNADNLKLLSEKAHKQTCTMHKLKIFKNIVISCNNTSFKY